MRMGKLQKGSRREGEKTNQGNQVIQKLSISFLLNVSQNICYKNQELVPCTKSL